MKSGRIILDRYLLAPIKFSPWWITDLFPLSLLLHSVRRYAAMVMVRVKWKCGNLRRTVIATPGVLSFFYFLIFSLSRPFCCLLEVSLEYIPDWQREIAQIYFPRPAVCAVSTLYNHEVYTSRDESGSLFAGNETGLHDSGGLHSLDLSVIFFTWRVRRMQILGFVCCFVMSPRDYNSWFIFRPTFTHWL